MALEPTGSGASPVLGPRALRVRRARTWRVRRRSRRRRRRPGGTNPVRTNSQGRPRPIRPSFHRACAACWCTSPITLDRRAWSCGSPPDCPSVARHGMCGSGAAHARLEFGRGGLARVDLAGRTFLGVGCRVPASRYRDHRPSDDVYRDARHQPRHRRRGGRRCGRGVSNSARAVVRSVGGLGATRSPSRR